MADTDKKEKKQKNLSRRSFGRNVAGSVVLLGVTVAANVAADMFSSFLDHYLGSGTATVTVLEGSEDWDTDYYTQEYRGRNAATEAAEAIVADFAAEGVVLLKNDNDALPLSSGTTVSLVGRYAADPVYGGAGSGTVDADSCIDFNAGLTNAGLTVNSTAFEWISSNYDSYDKANIVMDDPSTSTYYIGEIPWEDYSSSVQASIEGTTGVLVVGRGGGEGGDLSRDLVGDLESGVSSAFVENSETANYVEGQHELELCAEELGMVAALKEICDKVIVLVNASTTMELGPLMSGDYEVDAILAVGSLGATGATGVGNVLAGNVNPSGRTCDLWAADFTADPTFENFGGKQYEDVSDFYGGTAYFSEYKEGIYYGYRYYETAYAEAEAGNYDGFDYDSAVVFPFGYGLSYTTFDETLDSVEVVDDNVEVSVTVTNSGSVAGKDVVEIYYTAPYTSGGIEKSAVVLGAFAKTSTLEAGASETVELSYPVKYMSSWSMADGYYVLDGGDYVVSLRSDSHNVIDEVTLTLDAVDYTEDEATGTAYTNLFPELDAYMEANCENLSRADFAGTWPSAATNKNASDCGITFEEYVTADHLDDSDEMPTTGADNGLSLIDLRGVDFDDEEWDTLLDELTVDDMTTMLNDDAYNTPAITSINKPATSEPDGPAGFTSLSGSTGNCAYCSEFLMAQTWNTELLNEMGLMIGQEALASGYNGWYAPGMNTHRSPFAGRNFEYYAEDPLLAGKLASAVVEGCATNGVYAMCKHYCVNDQETYRTSNLCMWLNEQTLREVYLKPFEIAVKESTYEMNYIADEEGTMATKTMPACTGIMSSFNYVGNTWAGGNKALCTSILRDEWGFKGCVITDFNLYNYMVIPQAIAAGTDLELTYSSMKDRNYEETSSATVVQQLRTGSKHVLYTVANSNAMQGLAPGSTVSYSLAPWEYALYGVSAVLVVGAGYFAYRAYTAYKAKKEAAEAEA